MGTSADSMVDEGAPGRAARIRRCWPLLAGVAIVVAAIVPAALWFHGGGRLRVAPGDRLSTPAAAVGVPVNDALPIAAKDAHDVVLRSVTADHSAGVRLDFAVAYTAPGALGVGSSVGVLKDYRLAKVDGARIGDGRDRYAWLVITVVPQRAGAWRVTHFKLSYRSWWRHRHVGSAFVLSGTAS